MSAAIFVLVLSFFGGSASHCVFVWSRVKLSSPPARRGDKALLCGGARHHDGGRTPPDWLAGRPVRVRGGGGLARRRVLPEPGRVRPSQHDSRPHACRASSFSAALWIGDRGADVTDMLRCRSLRDGGVRGSTIWGPRTNVALPAPCARAARTGGPPRRRWRASAWLPNLATPRTLSSLWLVQAASCAMMGPCREHACDCATGATAEHCADAHPPEQSLHPTPAAALVAAQRREKPSSHDQRRAPAPETRACATAPDGGARARRRARVRLRGVC